MQVELFNRRKWKTRIELAARSTTTSSSGHPRRRHSALGMRTPIEIEAAWLDTTSTPALADPGHTGARGCSYLRLGLGELRQPQPSLTLITTVHRDVTIPNDNNQAA